jgi:N-acetylglucosamine kinase-like BadF-type ATPase
VSTDANSLGLGIDAGGTQTRWALARATGEIIASGHVGGWSALQANSDSGVQHIRTVLVDLANAVGAHGKPVRVYAGLTGFSEGGAALRVLIADALGVATDTITLGSDIEIAYLDAYAPGEGYLVYAGTGSIAAFIDSAGNLHRAGGRGVLLDDAGGGFWIAREALRHIWRTEDEHPESWRRSPMAREIFARIGGSDWAQTRQFMYGASNEVVRGEIGKLAMAVAAIAEIDPVARGILVAAGGELARLARAMSLRFGPRPITLSGRVAQLHPAIADAMRAALPQSTHLQVTSSEAHCAAARIAARGTVAAR